jgi:hypothetical protein
VAELPEQSSFRLSFSLVDFSAMIEQNATALVSQIIISFGMDLYLND